ncbi:hypothetical protein ACSFB8_08135 [Enterococcus faecalis]
MSLTIRLFMIEDSPLQQKKNQSFIKRIFEESHAMEVQIIPLLNLKKFYEEIPLTTFYPTDVFVIDYDLNSYFNGIDVAKKIRSCHPEAIISLLTAYPDQAISVINAGIAPVAYIVKSPEVKEMETSILQLAKHVALSLHELSEDRQKIILSVGPEKKLIPCTSICYLATIKKERNRIFVEMEEEQLIASASWKDMRQLFYSNKNFVTFKSYIFNLEAISHYSRVEKFIRFKNGAILFLGTKILDRLIKELERKHQ